VGRPPRAPSSRLSTCHPFPVRHRTSERCSPLTLCPHSRMPRPGCGVLPAHPPPDAACPPHLPVEHPASAPDAHNGARMGTSLPCWAPRPNPVGRSPTFGRPIRRPERRVISRLGGGDGSVGGCGHATSERPRPLRDATPPIDYRKHRIAPTILQARTTFCRGTTHRSSRGQSRKSGPYCCPTATPQVVVERNWAPNDNRLRPIPSRGLGELTSV